MAQKELQDKQGRIARRMVIVAWVFGLGFLTYLFQGVLDRQHNPNQRLDSLLSQDGVREVRLLRNRQGHYVADGSINGNRVTFLLDTGATDVAVPEALARELRLPRLQPGMSRTANGVVRVWRTRLEQVRLGALLLENVRATIVPSMPADAEVLLGMSFLKQLELIQRDGVLTLRQGGAPG